jgi:O-antigen ligase
VDVAVQQTSLPHAPDRAVSLDRVIELGLLFLLVFTPLALGTVQDWSVAIMELAAFSIFIAWAAKSYLIPGLAAPVETGRKRRLAGSLAAILVGVFAGLALLQLIPLPESVLTALSPGTAALYQALLDSDGARHAISLHPHATGTELLKLLAYAAVFTVIVHHYTTEEKLKGLFKAVIYMGCFLAFLAMAQKLFGNGKLLWFVSLKAGSSPIGPYINRNHFAGYMELAAPIALGYYLHAASRMPGLMGKKGWTRIKQLFSYLDDRKFPSVAFGLVAVLLTSGALFMTLSRGGITGFIASMLVFLWMVRSRRSLKRQSGFMLLLGGVVAFAVVIAGWSMYEARFERAAEDSAYRTDTWTDSIPIVREYPLLGTGLGAFDRTHPMYQQKHPHTYFEHAENEYIEVLVETGIAGLALVLAAMALYFSSVIKRWRERHNAFVICFVAGGVAACAALAVHGMTDFNLRIPANALLLTVIAAATYATAFKVPSRGKGKS